MSTADVPSSDVPASKMATANAAADVTATPHVASAAMTATSTVSRLENRCDGESTNQGQEPELLDGWTEHGSLPFKVPSSVMCEVSLSDAVLRGQH